MYRPLLLVVAASVCFWPTASRAQIYRWDNGQLIPGTEGVTLGPGADLSEWNTDLHSLLYGDFSGRELADASFYDSRLDFATFKQANLTQSDLTRSHLSGAVFNDAIVVGTDLSGTTSFGFSKEQLYSTASYRSRNLQDIKMSYCELTGWDFSGQDLSNATLSRSNFSNANLAGANLSKAFLAQSTFTNANLEEANLVGARLGSPSSTEVGSTMNNARLRRSDLTDAMLVRTDLTNADLRQSKLKGADFYQSVLTNADLTGAEIAGASLGFTAYSGSGFTKEQLYSTISYQTGDLQGISLFGNDLTGWDFNGKYLVNASFNMATLTHADLSGADLRGALWSRQGDEILKNTILPDGQVNGLKLATGESFLIRDEDGVLDPEPRLPTPVKIQQQMTVADGGVLRLRFETDAWDSTISFQPGIPVQLGGKLELTYTDDTQLATQSGRTIKAFDWTAVSPQGRLTVQGQPGTAWDTSMLYTTGAVMLLGISSDLNRDKDVDSQDLTEFLAHWTGSEYPAADKTWQQGDSDEDGDVDSADVLVFLSQWTGAAATELSRAVTVPEPVGLGMICTVVLGMSVRLRRRRDRR